MIFTIAALTVLVVLASANVQDKEITRFPKYTDSYMFPTEDTQAVTTQQALRGSAAVDTQANPGGNSPGVYASVTHYTSADFCGGNSDAFEFFKVGECVSAGDGRYMRVSCWTDTGKITGDMYADSSCTSTPTGTLKTLNHGQCQNRLEGYCWSRGSFEFRVLPKMQKRVLMLTYPEDRLDAAQTNDFQAAIYGLSVTNWGWNEVHNLRKDDRMECNPNILPPNAGCVDTTRSRSYSLVYTSLTEGKMNLYSKFNGGGEIQYTTMYTELPVPDGFFQWNVYRHLERGWENSATAAAAVEN